MCDVFSFFGSKLRQGCVLAITFFNTCIDLLTGKMVRRPDCGILIEESRISDLAFLCWNTTYNSATLGHGEYWI